MKKISLSLLLLAIATSPVFATKVYQWRDAEGRVFYSDQPPAVSGVKERSIRPNIIGNASQVQVKPVVKDEVVLWVSASCEPACSQALAMLDLRQVQYEVRNVDPANEKTMLAFFTAVGTMQARPPVLMIGKEVLKEWNSPVWQAALSKAGYPLPRK
ncbi:DUF4124 domain-containing protein [Chitinibacter sp. GC72]|uniref:DUF4124 domain-containing protein n=1 Tax=Chitinibacter sp. GC72 TaxID=1526917 RepID=UPI0012F9834E|nr:DUF4124 domain-containing protein [Chitinibacter sp. GC72]